MQVLEEREWGVIWGKDRDESMKYIHLPARTLRVWREKKKVIIFFTKLTPCSNLMDEKRVTKEGNGGGGVQLYVCGRRTGKYV